MPVCRWVLVEVVGEEEECVCVSLPGFDSRHCYLQVYYILYYTIL